MTPGPPPKPTNLRMLEGNLSRRPLNKHEPQPLCLTEDVAPPDWLNDAGKQVWRELVPELVRCGLLTALDTWTFGRYCDMSARRAALGAFLDANGSAYEGTDTRGRPKLCKRPEVEMFAQLGAALLRIEVEMGMTPASRSRIHIQPPQPLKPRAKFDYND